MSRQADHVAKEAFDYTERLINEKFNAFRYQHKMNPEAIFVPPYIYKTLLKGSIREYKVPSGQPFDVIQEYRGMKLFQNPELREGEIQFGY